MRNNRQLAYKYLLPRDTARVVANHVDNCENAALILHHYIPHEVIENRDIPNERNKKYRDRWFQEFCDLFHSDDKVADWLQILRAQFKRWIATTSGDSWIQFELRLRSRLVVGLGGKGPLEIGITLHPVNGLPYIPGSALKGLTRSYALYVIAEQLGVSYNELSELEKQLENVQNNVDEALLFRAIFGTQGEAGQIIFSNAVLSRPPRGSLFDLDVMTPHFPDYYRDNGKKPPSDDQNPNPVQFLTVAPGAHFAFAVGLRPPYQDKDLLEKAAGLLYQALTSLGVGAKTAAGYGYFTEPKQK